MSLSYNLPYTVQTYDIDKRRYMTVAALVKQMQEAAMQNVMEMKVSVWDMEEQHLSWVLLKKMLRINRLPMIGERLNFYTCPTGFQKVFTYRDYKVFDEKNELIASSSSSWLLLNTQTRRMSRIPPHILEFEKQMPPLVECLPRPDFKIPAIGQADLSSDYRVYWHDLDFNGHLNNVHYLQWMIETVPDSFLENGTLKAIDIQYKVESNWKDQTVCETQQLDDLRFIHCLKHRGTGKELAVGRSEWEK